MLNGVRVYRETDGAIRWLAQDHRGLIGLPIWINRKTTQGTFARFSWADNFTDSCWVKIQSPVQLTKPEKAKSARKSKAE
jgi:CRISPR-associated protein Cas5t